MDRGQWTALQRERAAGNQGTRDSTYRTSPDKKAVVDVVAEASEGIQGALGRSHANSIYKMILVTVLRKQGLDARFMSSLCASSADYRMYENTIFIQDQAVIELVEDGCINSACREKARKCMTVSGCDLAILIDFSAHEIRERMEVLYGSSRVIAGNFRRWQ